MKIIISPCPNDTFIFHAWVNGLLHNAPALDVTYKDIDVTNELASSSTDYDLLKISCAALPWVLPEYTLLKCGGALGRGCGPLLVTKKTKETYKSIAIPSIRSTAYFLLRLWQKKNLSSQAKTYVLPFNEIMPSVAAGLVDAGLVIHEARFTYSSYGLQSVVDLGKWWEEETNLPIPLGAIIAKKSLDIERIEGFIRSSLKYAWKNKDASKEYVAKLANEIDPNIINAHIDLYVNNFTLDLSEEGQNAISMLLQSSLF